MEKELINKIVILGCGYIGTNLANYMSIKPNTKIYVMGRENAYTNLLNQKIKYIKADIENIDEKYDEIFKDSIIIDAIGNSNATTSLKSKTFAENINSKIKMIEQLQKMNIKKYVFLSSGGTVYGDSMKKHKETELDLPINIYSLEKKTIEDFLRISAIENKKFEYLILRISNPYGGITTKEKKQGIIDVAIAKLQNDEILEFFGNIKNIRDYIYMDDLAKIILKLSLKKEKNDIYNIGTGKGYTIKKVFEIIEKEYNKKINIKYVKNEDIINIKSNVLDVKKMMNATNNYKCIELKEGIKKIREYNNKQ